MAFIPSPHISLDDAIKSGLPVYPITLTNWGNTGASADANSFSFSLTGKFQNSLVGMAIDPTSMVDRVEIVGWGGPNSGVLATTPTDIGFNASSSIGSMLLSKEAPFLFPVVRPTKAIATAWNAANTITFRALASQIFGDTYFKQGTVAAQTFGGALGGNIFPANMPTLRVLLFLRTPVVVPSMRSPYTASWRQTFAGAGAEALVRVIPVHGRKTIRAAFRTFSGAGQATIRVTGAIGLEHTTSNGNMFNEFNDTVAGLDTTPIETPDFGSGAFMIDGAVGQTAVLSINDPKVAWLLVYVATNAAVTLACSVEASD